VRAAQRVALYAGVLLSPYGAQLLYDAACVFSCRHAISAMLIPLLRRHAPAAFSSLISAVAHQALPFSAYAGAVSAALAKVPPVCGG